MAALPPLALPPAFLTTEEVLVLCGIDDSTVINDHKTSTSSVVKNYGGKAAGGKAAIMIQTWMVSFFYHYLYRDFDSDVYRSFFLLLSLLRSFYRVSKVFVVCS